jgi:hypothetical protein
MLHIGHDAGVVAHSELMPLDGPVDLAVTRPVPALLRMAADVDHDEGSEQGVHDEERHAPAGADSKPGEEVDEREHEEVAEEDSEERGGDGHRELDPEVLPVRAVPRVEGRPQVRQRHTITTAAGLPTLP